MLLGRRLLRRTVGTIRWHSSTPSVSSRREFKVVLDGETLYVEQPLAEALGWNPDTPAEKGVSLTLSGWAPNYFAIARTGTDSDLLARGTVESSQNPRVKAMLEYLKDR